MQTITLGMLTIKIYKLYFVNLRQEFSFLSNWFYDNCMALNPGKCHFNCCSLIWMFCSKKIDVVHERSLRSILNYYKSPYSLLLEEAHQIRFHQRFINSLFLHVHSPDIMNDILS